MPETGPTPRSPLDKVGVASPCQESWEAMEGDGKARFSRAASCSFTTSRALKPIDKVTFKGGE